LEDTARFGLSERSATGAYSYVDFDGDCDLDIVAVPITGIIRVFRNERNSANCIQIKLVDNLGNRSGIGSKVLIRYGGAAEKR
jgi:hypothetical protein